MLTALIAKIISGAYVGYKTNDLAIQMLFRKRFGLGGVVLRTRQEFITNISQLVERDIINHHTLSRELIENTGAFQKSIAEAVEDFFERRLWLYLPEDEPIASIAGFQSSLDAFLYSASQVIAHPQLQRSWHRTIHLIDWEIVCTPILLQALEQLLQELLELSQRSRPFLSHTLPYELLQSISPAALFSAEEFQQLGIVLFQPLENFHLAVQSKQVARCAERIEELLLDDSLLTAIVAPLLELTLGALLGQENGKTLVRTLASRLILVVESSEGLQLMENLADAFGRLLRQEQTTIYDLLGQNLASKFDAFLGKYLPTILSQIIEWLQARRFQLESMIDETFRKNIKWKLQDIILQLFVGSVSRYADVVKRITDVLNEHSQHPATTAALLTEQIIRFLKQNSIGQIVERLQHNQKRLSSPDKAKSPDAVALLLQKAIKQILQSPADEWLQFSALAERPLKELVTPQQAKFLVKEGLSYLWHASFLQGWCYQPAASAWIQQLLFAQWEKLYQLPVSALVTQAQFYQLVAQADAKLPQLLKGILLSHRQGIVNLMSHFAARALNTAQWSLLIATYLASSLEQLGKQPWKTVCSAFKKWSVALPAQLQQLLLQNLEFLLKGKIEAVVHNSLQKMPNEKLLELVERFMGRELKPITLLGALLGGIAGGILSFLPSFGTVSQLAWQDALLAAFAYGLTGYGTNWLALQMIFKPYRPIRWGGYVLPFTPGVVAKNQLRFAENMGKFVAGGLLNAQNIVAVLEDKKDQICQQVNDYVKNTALSIPEAWIAKYAPDLATILTDWAGQALEQHQTSLVHFFAEQLGNISLQDMPWERLFEQLKNRLQISQHRMGLAKWIVQQTGERLKKMNLATLWSSPDCAAEIASWALPLVAKAIEQLDPKSFLLLAIEQFQKQLCHVPLKSYLTPHQQEKLTTHLYAAFKKQLQNPALRQSIYRLIESRLAAELHPERPISQLFGGKLLELMNNNLDHLMEGIITTGLAWLEANKEILAQKVYEEAYARNKTGAFFYKSTIQDTVKELAERGIPEFFKKEAEGLKALVAAQVQRLGETPLGALGIQIDENHLKQLTNKLLESQQLHQSVKRILSLLIDEVVQMPVGYWIGLLPLQELVEKSISALIWKPLQKAILERLPELLPIAIEGILQIAQKIYSSAPGETFATGSNYQTFQIRCQEAIANFLAQPELNTWIEHSLQQWKEHLSLLRVKDLLPVEHMALQAVEILKKLYAQQASRAVLRHLVEQLLKITLPQLPKSLAPETLQALAGILAAAFVDTARVHLPAVVESIDIRKVVVRQIAEMNPQEIEELFYSFAANYFRQLINYGFGFGIAFGLVIDVALSIGLSYLVKSG